MKTITFIFCFIIAAFFGAAPPALAQQTQTLSSQNPPVNVTSEGFKFSVCDGPEPAGHVNPQGQVDISKTSSGVYKYPLKPGYVPCDFNGLMLQTQHLINIGLVGGVFAAIIGFCFIGYLYIRGRQEDIKRAKDIFPKIFWGFIIMLSAWFIVYQILNWLTGKSGFTGLLGNP